MKFARWGRPCSGTDPTRDSPDCLRGKNLIPQPRNGSSLVPGLQKRSAWIPGTCGVRYLHRGMETITRVLGIFPVFTFLLKHIWQPEARCCPRGVQGVCESVGTRVSTRRGQVALGGRAEHMLGSAP